MPSLQYSDGFRVWSEGRTDFIGRPKWIYYAEFISDDANQSNPFGSGLVLSASSKKELFRTLDKFIKYAEKAKSKISKMDTND